MKTFMKILGIFLIIINSIYILYSIFILSSANSMGLSVSPILLIVYIVPFVIGIILVKKSRK